MSKIIFISPSSPPTAFIAGLRRIIHSPLQALRAALAAGSPIYDAELFLNDHEEVAERMRAVLQLANDEDVLVRLYELPPKGEFEPGALDRFEITQEALLNILDEWDRRQDAY